MLLVIFLEGKMQQNLSRRVIDLDRIEIPEVHKGVRKAIGSPLRV